MTEQKKSAQTAATVQSAKTTYQEQFTPNSGKTQEVFTPEMCKKDLLPLAAKQCYFSDFLEEFYAIRAGEDVQRDMSLNSTGLLMVGCFNYGVMVGKRMERAKSAGKALKGWTFNDTEEGESLD